MTDYDRKYEAALEELSATDMWKANHTPPMLTTLRGLGLQVRPPHYVPFLKTFALYAGAFGPAWGVIMWFTSWRAADFTMLAAVGAAAMAGVLFGTVMAVYYARGRKKYRLTRWDAL